MLGAKVKALRARGGDCVVVGAEGPDEAAAVTALIEVLGTQAPGGLDPTARTIPEAADTPAPGGSMAVPAAAQPRVPDRARGALILIVDDEPFAREVTKRVLRPHGFTTELLTDGEDALERRFRDPVPALILMNGKMARMNGDVATRAIRAREAELALPRIPIILSSGYPRRWGRGAGFDGYLPRPFSVEDLLDEVLRVGWHVRRRRAPPAAPSVPEAERPQGGGEQ